MHTAGSESEARIFGLLLLILRREGRFRREGDYERLIVTESEFRTLGQHWNIALLMQDWFDNILADTIS